MSFLRLITETKDLKQDQQNLLDRLDQMWNISELERRKLYDRMVKAHPDLRTLKQLKNSRERNLENLQRRAATERKKWSVNQLALENLLTDLDLQENFCNQFTLEAKCPVEGKYEWAGKCRLSRNFLDPVVAFRKTMGEREYRDFLRARRHNKEALRKLKQYINELSDYGL